MEEERKQVALSDLHPFPEHPYQVRDDDAMQELVESISRHGLVHPLIVRIREEGGYEIIAGHRRKRACELLGLTEVMVEVRNLSRDEGILLMVDNNLKREELLPSEKGKAYRLRLEAMNRQGQRVDLTSTPVVSKLRGNEILAKENGISREQIRRYIRLTYLIPSILQMVDEKRIALRPGVEISYLKAEEQEQLFQLMQYLDLTPSLSQVQHIRERSHKGILTYESMQEILSELKPNQKEKKQLILADARIRGRIPPSIPKEKQVDYILQVIKFYTHYLIQEAKKRREEKNVRNGEKQYR